MENTETNRSENLLFFITIFLAGLCSLIYELLISTTSSYFLGDSVMQFSLTIGIYMAAMGIGSYLTKFFIGNLLEWFVKIELILGLIGGASVPILYFIFDRLSPLEYQFAMLAITFLIGVLTGFEIPLLVRILKENYPLSSNLAYVLSLDYIGALFATLLFLSYYCLFLGTFRTSIVFGLINIGLGLLVYRFFTKAAPQNRKKTIRIISPRLPPFFCRSSHFFRAIIKALGG